jgi:hypothetical protein
LFAVADLAGRVEIRVLPEGRVLASPPPPRPMVLRDFTLGASGDHLYLLRLDGRVHEWNLAQLRQEVSKLELGWP